MPAQKPSPVVRFFPSLGDVAFWLPVVFLFAKLDGARTLLGDGDTGWHIRTGEWILAHGRVPDRDIFSFTKPGEPWFAWEWLWDVIFASLHRAGGMTAVVLVSMLVISATFALLYQLVRRRCGNVLLAFAATFLAAAASTIHWLARPHLVTLLGVVLFLTLLERARAGRTRLLWLLPPLAALWTNLHGGFLVGIVLCFTYAAGELAPWVVAADPERRRAALASARPYLAAGAGCVLASFLNPYFYHLHVHIARYLTDPFQFEHISEFLPVNFQHLSARYYEVLLLVGLVTAAWNATRGRFIEALLLCPWWHFSLTSARNVPIFVIVAAPLVAEAVEYALGRLAQAGVAGWIRKAAGALRELGAELAEMENVPRVRLASLAAAAGLVMLFYLPLRPAKLRAEYDPKRYPEKALAALQSEAGRVFTNDEWGDFLIYRLYPNFRVFVDGRSDFYGAKFDEQYISVISGKYDWERTLDKYRIDTVLLPVDASLASTLKQAPRWRVVYDDGISILFRAKSAAAPPAPAVATEVGPPETMTVSVVTDSGVGRDREVAAGPERDPRITYPYARR